MRSFHAKGINNGIPCWGVAKDTGRSAAHPEIPVKPLTRQREKVPLWREPVAAGPTKPKPALAPARSGHYAPLCTMIMKFALQEAPLS